MLDENNVILVGASERKRVVDLALDASASKQFIDEVNTLADGTDQTDTGSGLKLFVKRVRRRLTQQQNQIDNLITRVQALEAK